MSLRLSKLVWQCFRKLSRCPLLDQNILSYCGPTLLVIIVVLWTVGLTTGFAFLFLPALGSGLQSSQGSTSADFMTAFYYSGFTLTTLGIGDLVPQTAIWRFITTVEAALGFSVFTVTLTYLLSVYSALNRRNAFALSLHHKCNGEGNAVALLLGIQGYNQFEPAFQDINDIARELLSLLESHHSYPVLHYFRFQEPQYAVAHIALVSLDLATLVKTALHPQIHRPLICSSAVTTLDLSGLDLLSQLATSFLDSAEPECSEDKQAWRCWYREAVEKLRHHGIDTVLDVEAGADRYILERSRWNSIVVRLAEYMNYRWHSIAPVEHISTHRF